MNVVGAYVSEVYSWRWIFFILIPVALLALGGVLMFIERDPPREARPKLDWTGFLSLSIAIACVQLMLDRGEREEWFDSIEIILECSFALLCGWIFLVHSLTTDRPFLDLRLLLERNFVLGIAIAGIFGMLFVTPMVLIPAMVQQLRDVPEFTVGVLIAMRGVGTVVSQVIMIFYAHRWSPRLLFLIGFATHTYAGLMMTRFNMDVSLSEMAWAMAIQGFGVGCLWVPMTLVTFSNFDPRRSAEGMALFHFVRSIASSYYISASFVVVFHTRKMNYSDLVQWINPFNDRLGLQGVMGGWSTGSTAGLTKLAGEVTRQATTIGYINSFNLFLWTSMIVYPLIALIVWPPRGFRPRP